MVCLREHAWVSAPCCAAGIHQEASGEPNWCAGQVGEMSLLEWSSMRAVVTGARGLLGEEVADWLEGNEGDQVVRLSGRDELDIADTQAVASFMRKAEPDFIVHCAAERDM